MQLIDFPYVTQRVDFPNGMLTSGSNEKLRSHVGLLRALVDCTQECQHHVQCGLQCSNFQ